VAYEAAMKRVLELEELVDDDTPTNDINALELDMLVDMIEEYELVHYPIGKPSLINLIKLRMYEMGLTKDNLAQLLGLSKIRVNDIMTGKAEPTLNDGRLFSQKLNIDPAVVLGL
jgi:HTH-type transcriptional regulator/antitoxin HigA